MKKKILITGGTGLIGSSIVDKIDKSKFHIHILSRSKREDTAHVSYFQWDIGKMEINAAALKVDYIINLVGAGIADKRWTSERKQILIDSRVNSIRLLAQGLKQSSHRPKAFISASAIGYYGDRADEILTEDSAAGEGFLPECCKLWEKAAYELESLVDRIVINRVGIVLANEGGALPKILMTKAIGVYNYFGDGSQYYSWIHIDDVSQIFVNSIENEDISGIYNAVSPQTLPNKEFTKKIKRNLGGIIVIPAPSFALRLVLGEMANVVLDSARVVPEKLQNLNFQFSFTTLTDAIRDLQSSKN